MGINYLYRFEEIHFCRGLDIDEEPLPGSIVKIHFHEYEVVKKTPKGVWIVPKGYRDEKGIQCFESKRRFVLLDARKRFACPSKKEALASFKARKHRQIQILSAQLKSARNALKIAEKIDNKKEDEIKDKFYA